MRAVNLLPRESRNGPKLKGVDRWSLAAAASTVVVIAALGGGWAVERAHAASEQRQLAGMRGALARVAKEQAASHAARAKQPLLRIPDLPSIEQPWSDAVSSALATRFAWDGVLADLERVVPGNVTLSNVALAEPGVATTTPTTSATATDTNGSCTIAGSSFSEDAVAQLLARLQLVHDFSQVTLASSAADPKTGVVTFQIEAQVTMPAATSAAATTTTTTTATTTTGGTA